MQQKITLIDQLGIVFLNALVGLLTGILLWVALNGFPWAAIGWLPAVFIIWFTAVIVILGMIFQDVILLKIYSKIWWFLVHWFKGGG